MRLPISFLALALAAVALGAQAAPAKPLLQVTGGWSRPATAGTNGVGYLSIVNSGDAADALTHVESPVAARVEMHAMTMNGNVMSMSPLERMAIPAHGKASFAPGGAHLMLVGLKRPLALGDKVPATLTFASGARLRAELTVGVMAPAM